MSYKLETENRGGVPEFGFWGPDTTKVMLGDLPGMPTPQFCRYSVEAIITALSLADDIPKEEIRIAIREGIGWASEVNAGKKIMSTQNPLNFPRQQAISLTAKEQITDEITVQGVNASRAFWEELDQAALGGDEERKAQLMEEYNLAVNASQGTTTAYPENPFSVERTNIVIGNMYVVSFAEFARFATHYIGGGFLGWDSRGVPDYAHESLERLKQALNIP